MEETIKRIESIDPLTGEIGFAIYLLKKRFKQVMDAKVHFWPKGELESTRFKRRMERNDVLTIGFPGAKFETLEDVVTQLCLESDPLVQALTRPEGLVLLAREETNYRLKYHGRSSQVRIALEKFLAHFEENRAKLLKHLKVGLVQPNIVQSFTFGEIIVHDRRPEFELIAPLEGVEVLCQRTTEGHYCLSFAPSKQRLAEKILVCLNRCEDTATQGLNPENWQSDEKQTLCTLSPSELSVEVLKEIMKAVASEAHNTQVIAGKETSADEYECAQV